MNASDILATVTGTLFLDGINASNILNTIAMLGILAYFGLNSKTVLKVVGKVASIVFGSLLKMILEEAIKRYSSRNRHQLIDVKVLQEMLQETEKSVVGTGDNYAKQLLEKNLDKCQKVCDQIESAGIFQSSSQQVEELDLLLRNSIHITNTYLFATSAGMKADLRHLRAVVHNLQAGMRPVRRGALTVPKKVTKLIVEELKPGTLHVSWKKTMAVDYYEVQYDRQTEHSIKVSSTQCLLDSMQLHFPSEKFYNIRVRGVNGCGPGEWSESAVGTFTILPEQPLKPLTVHVNSPTSFALVMEKPLERDGAKPVTHFVVEYHTDADKTCTKKVIPIKKLKVLTFEGKEAVKINLNDRGVNTSPTYHVLISHRNKDGDSLPRVECIETVIPHVPMGLKVAYQNLSTILIEWRNTNVCTVDHYEVHWELNKHTVNTEVTKNCYAAEQFLDSNKSYLIKVRAVNRSRKSEFTEIRATTKPNHGTHIMVFLPIISIATCIVTHKYKPVILFYALLVAMIATFLFISIKHAKLMHCLPALTMTGASGNVLIAVILYLRSPLGFICYVVAAVMAYIALFYSHREDTQLKHYMLEKNMVRTSLKEKQVVRNTLLLLYGASPAMTLFLYVLMQCFTYFVYMSYMTINTAINMLNYMYYFLDTLKDII